MWRLLFKLCVWTWLLQYSAVQGQASSPLKEYHRQVLHRVQRVINGAGACLTSKRDPGLCGINLLSWYSIKIGCVCLRKKTKNTQPGSFVELY